MRLCIECVHVCEHRCEYMSVCAYENTCMSAYMNVSTGV